MDKLAMRATLIDDALRAHEAFRELVTEREAAPIPRSQFVAHLHFGNGVEMHATFKHIRLQCEARPVLTGHNESAMEYSFSAKLGGKEVDVGAFYLIGHEGSFATDAKGDKNVLGHLGNWRAVDAIGAWLSDRVEASGLLTPRSGTAGQVGILV